MTADPAAAVQVRVAPPERLDWQAFVDVQRQVFGPVLRANGLSAERLSERVFRWKYAPPAGAGRIAVVEHGDRLVACNAMFPVQLARGGERWLGWQSCDTATLPAARGQGCFKSCLRALCDDLPDGAWFFGYPNQNSWHGFAAAGCDLVQTIPLAIRPVLGGGSACADVTEVTSFGARHDAFGERLVRADDRVQLLRTAAYLDWRYRQHPFLDYRAFETRRGDDVVGLLVVQRSVMRGRPLLCVLEFLATEPAAANALARHLRWFARDQGCRAILTLSSERVPGLWRLPSFLVRRPHGLLCRVVGSATPATPWHTQTGDWDVF